MTVLAANQTGNPAPTGAVAKTLPATIGNPTDNDWNSPLQVPTMSLNFLGRMLAKTVKVELIPTIWLTTMTFDWWRRRRGFFSEIAPVVHHLGNSSSQHL